jgi:hypothetical protein
MSILGIIAVIVIVGLLLWVVNSYIPMDATVKKILNVVVIILLIVFLLRAFGVWGEIANARVFATPPLHTGSTHLQC